MAEIMFPPEAERLPTPEEAAKHLESRIKILNQHLLSIGRCLMTPAEIARKVAAGYDRECNTGLAEHWWKVAGFLSDEPVVYPRRLVSMYFCFLGANHVA